MRRFGPGICVMAAVLVLAGCSTASQASGDSFASQLSAFARDLLRAAIAALAT